MRYRSRFEEVQAAKVEGELEVQARGPMYVVVAGAEPVILSARAFEALFNAEVESAPRVHPKGVRRVGRRVAAGSAAEAIRGVLKGGEKASGQIVKALPEVKRARIYTALHELRKRGLVKRDKAGVWSLQ